MAKFNVLKRKPILLIGGIAYLFFLCQHIPAAWIIQHVPMPEGIEPIEVSGTIWQGEAKELDIQQLQLQRVSWQFRPWYLLQGMPAFYLSGRNQEGIQTSGIAGWRWGWQIRKLSAHLPAEYVQQHYWPASQSVAMLHGRLDLNIDHLAWSQTNCEGTGTLRLSAGQIQMNNDSLQLDKTMVKFDCQDQRFTWSLQQQSATVATTLQGILDRQGYQLNGTLQTKGTIPAAFQELLGWLGNKAGKNNDYTINKHGQW